MQLVRGKEENDWRYNASGLISHETLLEAKCQLDKIGMEISRETTLTGVGVGCARLSLVARLQVACGDPEITLSRLRL